MTPLKHIVETWLVRVVLTTTLALVITACGGGASPTPTPTHTPAPTATAAPTWTPEPTITPILGGQGPYDTEPPMTINPSATYQATLRTNKGDIVIELRPDVAPRTVNSFVFLTREGFYDRNQFFRATNLLIQSGDPTNSGFGDAGYAIPLEKSDIRHEPGTVGLAHPNDNPFGSSQFYIMRTGNPGLDYQYTVFGQVIEGMDVVNAITRGDVIQTVSIEEK